MINYKRRNTIFVILLAFLFLSWVVFRIVFPVFHFEYNQQGNNDNFFVRTINQKKYLQLKLKGEYSFNKIILKSKRKDIKLGNVYQDELSLYQDGQQLNSLEDLKKYLNLNNSNVYNGQLISHGDSVFFIENGKYRTFADAETFDNLGFDWQKVVKVNNDVLHSLQKSEDITHTTIYLDNLFVKIDSSLYFLNNNVKMKINGNQLKQFVEKNFSIININKKKLDLSLVGKMICQQTFFGEKCSLKRNRAVVFPRAEILMEIKEGDLLANNKLSIKVDTFDGVRSVVPKITLRNIKRLINIRYKDEVIRLKKMLKLTHLGFSL